MKNPDWAKDLEDGILNLYMSLPEYLKEILDPCPTGGHQKEVWNTARALRGYIKDEAIVLDIMKERWSGYHKDVRPAVERAVSNVFFQNEDCTGKTWPKVNKRTIRSALVREKFGVDALMETSEVKDPGKITHQEIIYTLFGENALICMGSSPAKAFTEKISEMCMLEPAPSLIVPNPMTQKMGQTKDGRESTRCLANTGRRKHLVIEFDDHNFDTQATLHKHLGKYLPRVLTLSSGNKSIHGWYLCTNCGEDIVYQFMRYAVALGADRATYTPCQLVRTPNATRDNGKKQEVLTFNPGLI